MPLYHLDQSGPGSSGADVWHAGCHALGNLSLEATLAAWSAAVTNLWTGTPGIQGLCADATSVTGVKVVSIDEGTGQQISRLDDDLNISGTANGEPAPPQVSMLASFQSTLATRAGNGRMYLCPPAINATTTDNGVLTPASAQTLAGAIGAWWNDLTQAGLTLVIYHRPSGTVAGSTTPVSAVRAPNVLATQRRRLNKIPRVYS